MKRTALAIFVTVFVAGLAPVLAADDRPSSGAIRDRIRDRMEKKRLEHVPPLSSATKVPGAGPGHESILIKGQTRTFVRYTPNAVLVSSKRAPVVFALHGEQGTADKLQASLGLNAVADREGFIVVYPQGDGNVWNDGNATDSQAEDVAFLNGLADALVAQGVADAGRLFMVGLSNGGGMALALACNGESRFAGFAPVVASFPQAALAKCRPKRTTSVMMIRGAGDAVADANMAAGTGALPLDVARHFAALAACTGDDEAALPSGDAGPGPHALLRQWKACEPGRAVAVYTLMDGVPPALGVGSSSVSLQSGSVGAKASHGLDAAEAVWAFFKPLLR